MRFSAIHAYVISVVVAAAVAVVLQDWDGFGRLPTTALYGLALLTALGLFSEGTALKLRISSGKTTSSITFLPLLACVLLFGPAAAVLFFAANGLVAEFLIRKKEFIKASFNTSQYILSTAVGGWAFSQMGGEALALDPSTPFDPQFIAFGAFGVVFLVTNNLLVFLAIAITSMGALSDVMKGLVRKQLPSLLHDLFISPLGILIAFLYMSLGLTGIVISLFPLIFVRYSYLAKFRLEQANQDLLKALVMAIETRDQYTSGHSLRVQRLSESIGRTLGLSERKLEELSTAALLHDIGKIEVVYEEILQKPGALTDDERAIIQSHVTRGVEILTSLSSVNPRVIEAVKYHHEAWDGSGYPYGIKAEEIPLYARIIGVSDAIDAMLSDRPYRKALGIDQVREQLERFQGKQFDPTIARTVLANDTVRDHIEEISLVRGLKAFDVDSPSVRLPVERVPATGGGR